MGSKGLLPWPKRRKRILTKYTPIIYCGGVVFSLTARNIKISFPRKRRISKS
jgi:hypothetical protein